ncbi:24738_t:CDS:10 [Cetraspora pellucida]|uniref:24738_t:CDS:1 n=1 Tax=Cetraspora pellucida TaxID=1433469 RepID=A0A9N9GZ73_9GLOM|nr:24738_t:CDS:10 [Cetraspora pellucida]
MSNRGRGGCYKCGESGHLARDCSLSAVCRDCTETPKDKTCYKCGDSGHISRDCYSDYPTSNSGSKCFKSGHIARNCTNAECYKCGQAGHIARNCEMNDNYYDDYGKVFEEVTSFLSILHQALLNLNHFIPDRTYCTQFDCVKAQKCYNCGRSGHLSRDCDSPQGSKVCYNCQEEGHIRKDCPKVGAD